VAQVLFCGHFSTHYHADTARELRLQVLDAPRFSSKWVNKRVIESCLVNSEISLPFEQKIYFQLVYSELGEYFKRLDVVGLLEVKHRLELIPVDFDDVLFEPFPALNISPAGDFRLVALVTALEISLDFSGVEDFILIRIE